MLINIRPKILTIISAEEFPMAQKYLVEVVIIGTKIGTFRDLLTTDNILDQQMIDEMIAVTVLWDMVKPLFPGQHVRIECSRVIIYLRDGVNAWTLPQVILFNSYDEK